MTNYLTNPHFANDLSGWSTSNFSGSLSSDPITLPAGPISLQIYLRGGQSELGKAYLTNGTKIISFMTSNDNYSKNTSTSTESWISFDSNTYVDQPGDYSLNININPDVVIGSVNLYPSTILNSNYLLQDNTNWIVDPGYESYVTIANGKITVNPGFDGQLAVKSEIVNTSILIDNIYNLTFQATCTVPSSLGFSTNITSYITEMVDSTPKYLTRAVNTTASSATILFVFLESDGIYEVNLPTIIEIKPKLCSVSYPSFSDNTIGERISQCRTVTNTCTQNSEISKLGPVSTTFNEQTTTVLTRQGNKQIKNVISGDRVWSTEQHSYVKVEMNVSSHPTGQIMWIPKNNLYITSGHTILHNKKAIKARDYPGAVKIKRSMPIYSLVTEKSGWIDVNGMSVWASNVRS